MRIAAPKRSFQSGRLGEKNNARVTGQFVVIRPGVLLALHEGSHDLGICEVSEQRHLGDPAEPATRVALDLKPSLCLGGGGGGRRTPRPTTHWRLPA